MSSSIVISSINYMGQTADITFYPTTGGTVNLGQHVLPYTYISDYFFGSYNLYFSNYNKTCTVVLSPTTPTPTITNTPTVTPTITPTITNTPTITPTPTVTCSRPSGLTLTFAYHDVNGVNITTGSFNTFVGPNAGSSISTGNNNTFIGANTQGLTASSSMS
jgi:hypothetical protein